MSNNYFNKRNKFICPKCGHYFEVTNLIEWINATHLFDIWRYIKCPNCDKKSWMKITKEATNEKSNFIN